MAVMWPRTLPPDILANSLRSTECEVYRRLEVVLNDSFVVFYSRPWLGLKPDGEEIDGECDFVIAHARLGLLTLEVKGGGIAYDPLTDRWSSRDRWQLTHRIKNPVQQARSSKHELLKKLSSSPHWKPRWIRARHGVVLPHSSAPAADLGADMPLRLFCFAKEFESGLGDWIRKRFGEVSGDEDRTEDLGADGLQALEKILARPFQLRMPLGTALCRDDSALQVLTQQQFHILRAIEAVPRAAVSGGAGTGKTVLAMEEARRCAEAGARTLFVCYNRGLAVEVRARLKESAGISAMTFHELCVELSRQAGIAVPETAGDRQLFEEGWPEFLMQAFERLPRAAYDAIIVDEGQDFLPLWWTAVQAGLRNDGRGILRVFYDNNQRVYASAIRISEEVALIPIRLTLNLRNTRRIYETVRLHYTGHQIEAIGPEGVEVRWIRTGPQEALGKRVADYVGRLTGIERVPEGDIAVLVATENAVDDLAPGKRLGGVRTARCDEQAGRLMVVDSIRRFKGLERPVVVIAATPDTVINTELPYVALSRARTHLTVIGAEKVLERMRGG